MLDSLKPLNKEDFYLQDLLAPIDAHTKDIDNLLARIKILEDKFGSPTQLANTLLVIKIKQWMGWIAGASIFIIGAISNEFIKWLSHLLTL